MRLEIKIDCDNAAFEVREAELARILRKLADDIESGDDLACVTLFDVNGNRVGNAQLFMVKG